MGSGHFAVAGVDVGTNSALLTIARPVGESRALTILDERCVVTRLGEGLGESGSLSPAATARTLAVLEEFGGAIVALDARARAAGTSALRRAVGADAFLRDARAALGVPLEILSGVDEARLGYRGALSDLPNLSEHDNPVVVDPGGGSTEVVGGGALALSLEVGAVRLTESFLHSDPPASAEIDALLARVRAVVAAADLGVLADRRPCVAVGGTATTLAALALRLERYDGHRVHGFRLATAELFALAGRLAKLPLAQRELMPCLPAGRADIIVAGAFLLATLVDMLGATRVTVSDRGLRFGLIAELLATRDSGRWRK